MNRKQSSADLDLELLGGYGEALDIEIKDHVRTKYTRGYSPKAGAVMSRRRRGSDDSSR